MAAQQSLTHQERTLTKDPEVYTSDPELETVIRLCLKMHVGPSSWVHLQQTGVHTEGIMCQVLKVLKSDPFESGRQKLPNKGQLEAHTEKNGCIINDITLQSIQSRTAER